MKKILIYIFFFLSATSLFSQRTGISYQALILNPSGEDLPGVNNSRSPLINTKICLEFTIVDNRSVEEYSETQTITTDSYGMVNLIIGDGSQVGGYANSWDGGLWDGELKRLKIDLDPSSSCSNFKTISNQEITSVPFALFAPPSPAIVSKIATIETTIKDTETKAANAETKATAAETKATAAETKATAADTKATAADTKATAAQTKVIAVETKVTAAETQIAATDVKVKTAETQIANIIIEMGKPVKKYLIDTTAESAGENCSTGGTKIDIGYDSNADGILQPNEVDASLTKYVCNGVTPNKILVLSTAEAAGDNCVTGGLKIEIGEDANVDGVLQPSEVDSDLTKYVCNGAIGKNTLVITTVEAAGVNCTDGGVKIEVGLDADSDGSLSETEITSSLTKYICDGLVTDGSVSGNTPYWDGTKWITDSSLIFNDGTNVMIGTTTIDTTSAFTVASTTKGVMIPSLTKAQRDAITSPSTSLLIFQSDNTPGYYYYDGTVWKYLTNITSGTSNTSSGSSNLTLIYLSSF